MSIVFFKKIFDQFFLSRIYGTRLRAHGYDIYAQKNFWCEPAKRTLCTIIGKTCEKR